MTDREMYDLLTYAATFDATETPSEAEAERLEGLVATTRDTRTHASDANFNSPSIETDAELYRNLERAWLYDELAKAADRYARVANYARMPEAGPREAANWQRVTAFARASLLATRRKVAYVLNAYGLWAHASSCPSAALNATPAGALYPAVYVPCTCGEADRAALSALLNKE